MIYNIIQTIIAQIYFNTQMELIINVLLNVLPIIIIYLILFVQKTERVVNFKMVISVIGVN